MVSLYCGRFISFVNNTKGGRIVLLQPKLTYNVEFRTAVVETQSQDSDQRAGIKKVGQVPVKMETAGAGQNDKC
jgi:hypothetical protein